MTLIYHLVIWIAATLFVAAPASYQTQPRPTTSPAQSARPTQTPDVKIDRPTSEPYTGSLSIFEDPRRAEKLQIDRVMDLLGIKQGSVVADIGAGSGWFTVRAAQRAGRAGAVYAVDINSEYLSHIAARAEKEGLTNIRTVLGKEDDPLLPEASIDAILILKTYHEFSKPIEMLRAMRKSMRKNGRLGIIDRNGTGEDHGVARDSVVKEASRIGFTLVDEHDFVKADDMDYFLVFSRN